MINSKVVIIGGGIAGVSLGSFLHRKNINFSIHERENSIPIRGNAFLMHSDGIEILEKFLGEGEKLEIPGKTIDTFKLNHPEGHEIKFMKMEPWQCIRRKEIIDFLFRQIPIEKVHTGSQFSHFLYENEKAIAAVFKNGKVEYGDIFVGADGARSAVRDFIFGPTNYTKPEVQEVVGIAKYSDLAIKNSNIFQKYISDQFGLSFGYIPTSDEELVWFMQYDIRLFPLVNEDSSSLKEMVVSLLKNFPSDVHDILEHSDFEQAYLWHARDFDPLDKFHSENVVLIGDAAHLALPFTSAGTTNALIDSETLSSFFNENSNIETAFESYFQSRIGIVSQHTILGRNLKNQFLNPGINHIDDQEIPLITHQKTKGNTGPKFKKIHLLYFTDPICSTCWTIQPHIRKLKLFYSDFIEIEYCMAGLLPNWKNFNRGGIKNKEDAFELWKKLAENFDMPINAEVWEKDPIDSSFPPSIAFKAAQIQDTDKAVIFLRRLTEQLFLHGINITQEKVIMKEAYESGLDIARLKRDLNNRAKELFDADLDLANQLSINSLPTFIFTDRYDRSIVLTGFQTFDSFENSLKELIPQVNRKDFNPSPKDIFNQFFSLTTKEFSFLMNLDEESAIQELSKIHQKGLILKEPLINNEFSWRKNENSSGSS